MNEFKEELKNDKEKLKEVIESRIDPAQEIDPMTLPSDIWSNLYWDFMPPKQREEIMVKFLNAIVDRARKNMPIYKNSNSYKHITSKFEKLEEFLQIPILLKDAPKSGNAVGFREQVRDNRLILRPSDLKTSVVFESGGTKGVPSPTFLSLRDLEIESRVLARRCFLPNNFAVRGRLYNFYNPSHKGGKMIETASNILNAEINIIKRPEDGLTECIDKIKSYGIDSIACVQPPINDEKSHEKAAGVTFLDLYGEDHELFGSNGQVKSAFITGFPIPIEVVNLCEEIGLRVFTTWGSTEALPGATSITSDDSHAVCKHNNQHLLHLPHLLLVVKEEDGYVRLAKEGEDGILFVTTIARDGTIYLNYAIGDKAKLVSKKCPCGRTTPVIDSIRRVDDPSDLIMAGCRYV